MNRWWQIALGVLLVLALVLGGVYLYARAQMPALRGRTPYASPEEAMQALIADQYSGVQKVEIVRSGPDMPVVGNLWFIEARVWADARRDGKAMPAEGDNPGCFFLHLSQGWVFVPEGQYPELLGIGLRLLGDPSV